MKKYALIEKEKIVKFKNIDNDDLVIITKLEAHGYLPVEEEKVPSHDPITQNLSDEYVVQETKVLRKWTIGDKDFVEAKLTKIENTNWQALNRIQEAFGTADQNKTIVDILNAKDQALIAIDKAATIEDLRKIVF